MIFQTHVADVYNRGCSFWIRRSTHSPLLPLDGSSHNLSQSKIKICWKTEKTQFTAQAHATPKMLFVFSDFLRSLKSINTWIFKISHWLKSHNKSHHVVLCKPQGPIIIDLTHLMSMLCNCSRKSKKANCLHQQRLLLVHLATWLCTWRLAPVKLVVWLVCILHFLVVVYTKTCPCEIGCPPIINGLGCGHPSHNSPGLLGTIGSRHVSRADRLHVDRTYNWPSLHWS